MTTPNNVPNSQNLVQNETATGPGTIQNGFSILSFWNTGGVVVTVAGQTIPVNGKTSFPYTGKQYAESVDYDATGSTLLIRAIY